ncbi:hypothetical protein [Thiomicrospira sp. ALE5]|uniref:hypothetical protein n=1 Tax=Thiomicrospira sp. ALE5 TaxID=748650 RepID=UPI0008F0BF16|nr:hypothetical protein [Thiomicrospira sp. ALE5]SFR50482.1 hypothetical protein SAMN03092900_0360 [Thiomicrospira sp. ALE5]
MKRALTLFGASLLLASTSYVHAQGGDPRAGESLHSDANCLSCHTANPYSTAKTPNFERLVAAVNFCNVNLNTGWFDDEVLDVATYLNEKYYKYEIK